MRHSKVFARSSSAASAKIARQPTILLFGDSHAHAVQTALQKRLGKGQPAPFAAHRLLKEKDGRSIGDTSFETFTKLIGKLSSEDVVLSMIGGNQHAVFSTIQHRQAFDFFTPDRPALLDSQVEVVPYRALEEVFMTGLRKGDGQSLEALRAATAARVIHVITPPPKQENTHIEQFHETLFAKGDLANLGVSRPELRLKFWQLQTRILKTLCAEFEIEVMMPPARTINEEGFLRPEFYAQDATHANWRYGERIIREVERQYFSQTTDRGGK